MSAVTSPAEDYLRGTAAQLVATKAGIYPHGREHQPDSCQHHEHSYLAGVIYGLSIAIAHLAGADLEATHEQIIGIKR